MTPSRTAKHLTAPPRSRDHRLHNFCFPNLSWGAQRLLRCKTTVTTPTTAANQTQQNQEDEYHSSAGAGRSPWNLRTRKFRSTCNLPPPRSQTNGGYCSIHINGKSRNNSPGENNSPPADKSAARARSEERGGERSELSVALSKEEIEEDFLRMKGVKPQRRPKKRSRIVQSKLDRLFPGLYLYDITTDSYRTND